jgi:hypothetical protein
LAGSGPPPSPGAKQIFGVSGPSSIGHLRGAGAASAVVTDCAKATPPTLCIIFRRENRNPISETSPIKLVAAQTPAGVKLETLSESRGRDVNPAALFYSDSQPREGTALPISHVKSVFWLWVQL